MKGSVGWKRFPLTLDVTVAILDRPETLDFLKVFGVVISVGETFQPRSVVDTKYGHQKKSRYPPERSSRHFGKLLSLAIYVFIFVKNLYCLLLLTFCEFGDRRWRNGYFCNLVEKLRPPN